MDRQVRRMVAHRTGDESNANADTGAEAALAAIPSDSDDDKNDNVKIDHNSKEIHDKTNFKKPLL